MLEEQDLFAMHKLVDMFTHKQQFHHHWGETGQKRESGCVSIAEQSLC